MPPVKIALALLIDLVAGDPHWFPHPVRAMGAAITALEGPLRRHVSERAGGVLLVVIVVVASWLVGWYLSALSPFIEIILAYTCLAVRSLADEAMAVERLLDVGDLEGARRQAAMLVSRETAELDEADVARAAVESVAENISDGIVAPLFYLFLGGVPLALAYKAASTLDSMVGYKNERYLLFGRAAARLDDALNFIPARITGFILVPLAALVTGGRPRGALRAVMRDRLKHASPNAAHGEAAVAGALGIRMGGPSVYFGRCEIKPVINNEGRTPRPGDIRSAAVIAYVAAALALCLGAGALWLAHCLQGVLV